LSKPRDQASKKKKKDEKTTAVKYKTFGIAMPCGLKRIVRKYGRQGKLHLQQPLR